MHRHTCNAKLWKNMAEIIEESTPEGCDNRCQTAPSIEALNRMCYCLSLDHAL